jgi:hypothetical protein
VQHAHIQAHGASQTIMQTYHGSPGEPSWICLPPDTDITRTARESAQRLRSTPQARSGGLAHIFPQFWRWMRRKSSPAASSALSVTSSAARKLAHDTHVQELTPHALRGANKVISYDFKSRLYDFRDHMAFSSNAGRDITHGRACGCTVVVPWDGWRLQWRRQRNRKRPTRERKPSCRLKLSRIHLQARDPG